MYLSPDQIRARFAAGDRCFAVVDGGEIASYMWVAGKTHQLSEAYLSFRCGPNQAWLYNAVTVKSARGKGYYKQLFRHLSSVLGEEGTSELYGFAEEANAPSRAGMRKAGFAPVVRFEVTKILSSRRFRVHVFDAEAWAALRATAIDLPAAGRVDEVSEPVSVP